MKGADQKQTGEGRITASNCKAVVKTNVCMPADSLSVYLFPNLLF